MSKTSNIYYWLEEGNEITGQMIADVITEHRDKRDTMIKLYNRYKGDKTAQGIPIYTREPPIQDTSKINNKLANDFFSDIVDTKTGYMAGQPITYDYEDEEENVLFKDSLKEFLKRNAISDLDSETVKMAAICGYSVRFCFINPKGDIEVINVPPWECAFITDELGITDADYAIRYYDVEKDDGSTYTKAEFYTPELVTYWIRNSTNSNEPFLPDPTEVTAASHLMAQCPLICFPNNEELLGDCDKILSLIDGYDKTISDMNSEIEQFRLAYLAFYGLVPDTKTLDLARQTGMFGFPTNSGENARMEFVTKNINDMAVQAHLQKLEDNIYMFGKSVKITDVNFANASGVAMKYKMFSLESKTVTTERKFTKALYRMFDVLSGYFEKKGITYDPWKFTFVFTRNFPLDLMAEVQILGGLKGLVSDRTALSQMSFIEDVDKELELMQTEQEEYNKYAQQLEAEMAPEEEMPQDVTEQEPQPEEQFTPNPEVEEE